MANTEKSPDEQALDKLASQLLVWQLVREPKCIQSPVNLHSDTRTSDHSGPGDGWVKPRLTAQQIAGVLGQAVDFSVGTVGGLSNLNFAEDAIEAVRQRLRADQPYGKWELQAQLSNELLFRGAFKWIQPSNLLYHPLLAAAVLRAMPAMVAGKQRGGTYPMNLRYRALDVLQCSTKAAKDKMYVQWQGMGRRISTLLSLLVELKKGLERAANWGCDHPVLHLQQAPMDCQVDLLGSGRSVYMFRTIEHSPLWMLASDLPMQPALFDCWEDPRGRLLIRMDLLSQVLGRVIFVGAVNADVCRLARDTAKCLQRLIKDMGPDGKFRQFWSVDDGLGEDDAEWDQCWERHGEALLCPDDEELRSGTGAIAPRSQPIIFREHRASERTRLSELIDHVVGLVGRIETFVNITDIGAIGVDRHEVGVYPWAPKPLFESPHVRETPLHQLELQNLACCSVRQTWRLLLNPLPPCKECMKRIFLSPQFEIERQKRLPLDTLAAWWPDRRPRLSVLDWAKAASARTESPWLHPPRGWLSVPEPETWDECYAGWDGSLAGYQRTLALVRATGCRVARRLAAPELRSRQEKERPAVWRLICKRCLRQRLHGWGPGILRPCLAEARRNQW